MAQEKQAKSRAKKNTKIINAYKEAFSGPKGSMVLHDLMISTGFSETSFVPGDPYASAFKEGARSAVVRIIKTLNIDPEAFQRLLEDVSDSETEVLENEH